MKIPSSSRRDDFFLRWRIPGIVFGLLCCFGASAVAPGAGSPTPDGMLPHIESLIALAVVLVAICISWLTNHRSPKPASAGVLLAALSCLAIVLWFALAIRTGVLESPKPHQAPMDAAKPFLLWAQMSIALMAGLWLLRVAFVQLKKGDLLELGAVNEFNRYGRVSRILHWTTAILFIFMIPTGIFSSMIPEDAWYRTEYNVVHKTIGIAILQLFFARLWWNRVSPRPPLDPSLKSSERKMAHGAHAALKRMVG